MAWYGNLRRHRAPILLSSEYAPSEGRRPLFRKFIFLCLGLFLLSSLNIGQAAYDTGGSYFDYSAPLVMAESGLIADEEGYLMKSMPLSGEAMYLNRGEEEVKHLVQASETLSILAYRYGLKINTILWANPNLGSGNYLKVGQEIIIPPQDGIKVKVGKGDTWEALAKKYKGEVSKMKEFNEAEALIAGKEIFIPNGIKPQPVYVVSNYDSSAVRSAVTKVGTTAEVEVVSVGDGTFIRPTTGILTRGYGWGHYAYDIANRNKPPILAVASGVVTKSQCGWNGGYGCMIIIDHENGYQSLYAHLEELYVSVGQAVSQGDVIGKMGNTGRVWGATGIHLHFELIRGGYKIRPTAVFGF